MTVPASTRRAGPFSGNGATTAFPFAFKVFTADDIEVRLADAGGVETTVSPSAYTVTLNADQDATPGGTVTMSTPPATGETLAVVGAMLYDQGTDLPTGGRYSATVVENALDKLTVLLQQIAELTGRSLTLPATAAAASTELPAPVAGNVIGWDGTGSGLRNIDPATLASVVAYANRHTLVADGGAPYYTLTRDPGNVSNTLVAVSGVVQTPGVDYVVSGTTLTPTTPWPAGTGNVVAIYGEALPVGTVNAADVAFAEPITAAAVYVKTISDIVSGMPVSFLRFVPNTQHGAILAGTSTVDHHPNLQTAVNAAPVLSFDGLRRVQIGNNVDLPDADVTITGTGRIHGAHAGYIFGQTHRGRLFKLRGMTFTGLAAGFRYDGGAGLYGTQVYEYEIDSCRFLQDAGIYAIALIGVREGQIRNSYFVGCDGVYASYAINTEVIGCHFKNCGAAVYYDVGSEGLWMQGGVAIGCTVAVQAWRTAGVRLSGVTLDYNDTSVLIRGCSKVNISNSYITGRNTAPAVKLTSTGAFRCNGVKIIGNDIGSEDTMSVASDCLLIEDTDDFVVSDNNLFNWKINGVKTGNGCTQGKIHSSTIRGKETTTAGAFVVGGHYTIATVGTTDFTLIGASANTVGVAFTATGIGAGTGTATPGRYSIVTGTGDDTISVDGNTVGKPMSLTGTRMVRRNAGWTTEARGEITSGTGTTTVTIPHGLAMTPLKRDVTLVPTSVVQAGLRWWLSGTDATNITITTDTNITTAITWKWEATIQA